VVKRVCKNEGEYLFADQDIWPINIHSPRPSVRGSARLNMRKQSY
jgi:hypothetical protein